MSIDFEKATPHEILEFVREGGMIDRQGIKILDRHLNEDWIIDLHEAEFLFQVNCEIGDRDEKLPGWAEFFSEHIAKLLLFDLHTPGELCEAEGNWLADQLDKFGCGNHSEKTTIELIRNKAQSIQGRFADSN